MKNDDSPLLQRAGSDTADPLVRAMLRAHELEPKPERLDRTNERLLAAIDAMSASGLGGSPTPVALAVSRKGLAVVGLALALLQAPARHTSSESTIVRANPSQTNPVVSITSSIVVPTNHAESPENARLQESKSRSATELAPHPARREGPRRPRFAENVSELELLRAAQRALPDSPSAALARLAEHRAIYPHGLLAQERQVLQIQSLLASQRVRLAREAAAAFARDFPGSAHLRRIERMLEEHENNRKQFGNSKAPQALTD